MAEDVEEKKSERGNKGAHVTDAIQEERRGTGKRKYRS